MRKIETSPAVAKQNNRPKAFVSGSFNFTGNNSIDPAGQKNGPPDLPGIVHETMDEHLNASFGISAQAQRRRNLDIKQNFIQCNSSTKRRQTCSKLSRNQNNIVAQSLQVPSSMRHYTRFDAPKPNGKLISMTEQEWRYSSGDKIPNLYQSINSSKKVSSFPQNLAGCW